MDGNSINYYDTDWHDTVGYMEWHLQSIKKRGANPRSLIDIGAAHGDFSKMFLEIWPESTITAFEANQRDAHYLDETNWDIYYKALGEKEETKTFYLNPDDPVGGGSSLYCENTEWFENANKEKMQVYPLDSFDVQGDFVKIDVQGAELDVIKGGHETLANADYLLLELSFLNYNEGAPLIDEVLRETYNIGFRIIDTFGPVRGGHIMFNKKNQVDVLLTRQENTQMFLV